MKTVHRLLMAGTFLTTAASMPIAALAQHATTLERPLMLAQVPEPEKKPEAVPPKPAPPPPRPAPPAAAPPRPPGPPAGAPPHPPGPPAGAPPHVEPPRPVAPPPRVEQPRPVPPPVAQPPRPVAPTPPPAVQQPRPLAPPPPPPTVQQPRPVAPPPSSPQGAPPINRPLAPSPGGAQIQPQTPPGAPRQPAAIVPNTQAMPLQRSGIPAPTAQQARPIAPTRPGAGIAPQSAQGQPLTRVDQLRGERRQTTEGNRVVIREPDRAIIREGGQTIIRHNEADRFRLGAQNVRVDVRGGNNVTTIVRPGGERIVNTLDANGFLMRRVRVLPNGQQIILIDNRPRSPGFARGGGFGGFFINLPPPRIRIPRDRYIVDYSYADPDLIYQTLEAPPVDDLDRAYSLDEIRYSAPLRDRMPRIDLDTVTFETGSWDLDDEAVQRLAPVAAGINRAIERNPREIFLIEGFTDAVGNDVDNLSLSDRRAESVAIALTEQFGVPPENLATQGYGEQYLKVPTDGPERANRRVAVQRITPLLAGR